MCVCVLPLEIQLSRGNIEDPIYRFNAEIFSACPKQIPGFPTSYVVVYFVVCSVS